MNRIVKIGGIAAIAVALVAGGLVIGLAVSGGLRPNSNSTQSTPYAYGPGYGIGETGGQFGYELERGYDGTTAGRGDQLGCVPDCGRGYGGMMDGYGPGGMMGGRGGQFGYGRNRGRGFGGMMGGYGPGMMGGWGGQFECGPNRGRGFGGMMGGYGPGDMMGGYGPGMMGGFVPDETLAPAAGETLTLEEVSEVAEAYIAAFGSEDLELAEVMQFSNHFYGQAREESTGVNAFEFLIDPFSGAVHPEPGPNMMWNAKYGHMGGGMMGGWDYDDAGEMTVTPEEAREAAQAYLDTALPGATADEDVDTFYGYYTLHILRDGQVAGMLSVNGSTGQVWPHRWHGEFIDMLGHEE